MDYPYNFIANTTIEPLEVMANFLAIKTSDSLKASIAQVENLRVSFEEKFNLIVQMINDDLDLTGWIFPFIGNKTPRKSLLCDGREYSRETYKSIFDICGIAHGAGNNVDTFNIVDLRGIFIRGLDNGRGLDPGRVFGSYQEDATQRVYGRMNSVNRSPIDGVFRADYDAFTTDTYKNTVHHFSCSFDNSRVIRTADEERVKSVALNFYVRY